MPIDVSRPKRAMLASALIANLAPVKALNALEPSRIIEGSAGKRAPYEPPMPEARVVSTRLSPVPEEAENWTREAVQASYDSLEDAFGHALPKRADDGLGKRVSVTSVQEGSRLWAPKGARLFLRDEARDIAPGSFCVVKVKREDNSLWVEFHDAETGEVLRGDVDVFALRWPVPPLGVDREAL